MEGDKRFNLRVYGIWIHEGRLLVNEELIRGHKVIKFPGGGMEYGEGTVDCLKREWKEELGLDIEVGAHFYTTDYFQPSAYGESQVVSIYYLVSVPQIPEAIINHVAGEKTYWVDLSEVNEALFTLPIDKIVGSMIRRSLMNH